MEDIEILPTKKCPKCLILKGVSEFNKCKKAKDGIQHLCKSCSRLNYKEYYSLTKEKRILKSKEWGNNNRERCKYHQRTMHSKRKDTLSDTYIKAMLSAQSLPITPEIIELKRNIILIKRLKKEHERAKSTTTATNN